MKSMFSHSRTRFTAAVMLFVWLLTLGAGIANACLLHNDHVQTGHVSGAAAQERREAGSGLDSRAVAQAVTAAVDKAGAVKSLESIACRSLCVAGQMAVPKHMARGCGDPSADPVLVATCRPFSVLASPVSGVTGVAHLPGPELPVFIRFLRLTL